MEDVLIFCASVLTIAMTLGVVVWFGCSIVESAVKTRRRLERAEYNALLRENKRLKGFLADAKAENSRLRFRLGKSYSRRIARENTVEHRAA